MKAPTTDSSPRPHVVIIGAGFGGLNAAKSLGGAEVDVTVIDRRNHHLFQPLLYQVATAGLADGDVATPVRLALKDDYAMKVMLADAEALDLERRRVVLRDHEPVSYDYLVVAAGARTNYRGDESARTHGLGLKSLEDAHAVRNRVLSAFEAAELETDPERRRQLLTFVVVGGGPTGVELAGAFCELAYHTMNQQFSSFERDDIRVILVEIGPRLLTGFAEELSAAACRQLEQLGVETHLDAKLSEIEPSSVCVDGERVQCSVLCWAAGVEPESVAECFQSRARDGRVVVRPDCSLADHPEVFVIGDMAYCVPDGADDPLPGLAPVAIQQGQYVSRAIRADLADEPRPRFAYRDKGIMATVGRSRAIAQRGRIKLAGSLAWLAWLFVHVAFLVGFRNRASVLFNWFWSYITYQRGYRVISGPVGDLPALRASAAENENENERAA